jgi:Kef-type K+ transport system membrane component KefB
MIVFYVTYSGGELENENSTTGSCRFNDDDVEKGTPLRDSHLLEYTVMAGSSLPNKFVCSLTDGAGNHAESSGLVAASEFDGLHVQSTLPKISAMIPVGVSSPVLVVGESLRVHLETGEGGKMLLSGMCNLFLNSTTMRTAEELLHGSITENPVTVATAVVKNNDAVFIIPNLGVDSRTGMGVELIKDSGDLAIVVPVGAVNAFSCSVEDEASNAATVTGTMKASNFSLNLGRPRVLRVVALPHGTATSSFGPPPSMGIGDEFGLRIYFGDFSGLPIQANCTIAQSFAQDIVRFDGDGSGSSSSSSASNGDGSSSNSRRLDSPATMNYVEFNHVVGGQDPSATWDSMPYDCVLTVESPSGTKVVASSAGAVEPISDETGLDPLAMISIDTSQQRISAMVLVLAELSLSLEASDKSGDQEHGKSGNPNNDGNGNSGGANAADDDTKSSYAFGIGDTLVFKLVLPPATTTSEDSKELSLEDNVIAAAAASSSAVTPLQVEGHCWINDGPTPLPIIVTSGSNDGVGGGSGSGGGDGEDEVELRRAMEAVWEGDGADAAVTSASLVQYVIAEGDATVDGDALLQELHADGLDGDVLQSQDSFKYLCSIRSALVGSSWVNITGSVPSLIFPSVPMPTASAALAADGAMAVRTFTVPPDVVDGGTMRLQVRDSAHNRGLPHVLGIGKTVELQLVVGTTTGTTAATTTSSSTSISGTELDKLIRRLQMVSPSAALRGMCAINGSPMNLPIVSTYPSSSDGQLVVLVVYEVAEGDDDLRPGSALQYSCNVEDEGGNVATLSGKADGWSSTFSVDAHSPVVQAVRVISSTHTPARIDTVMKISIDWVMGESGDGNGVLEADESVEGQCLINEQAVQLTANSSVVKFVVKQGQADCKAGGISYSCSLKDSSGNIGESKGLVGGIPIAIDAHSPEVTLVELGAVGGKVTDDGTASIGTELLIRVHSADDVNTDGDVGLSGSCQFNYGPDLNVTDGVIRRTVQVGDVSSTEKGVVFSCDLVDAAGNRAHSEGKTVPMPSSIGAAVTEKKVKGVRGIDATPPLIEKVEMVGVEHPSSPTDSSDAEEEVDQVGDGDDDDEIELVGVGARLTMRLWPVEQLEVVSGACWFNGNPKPFQIHNNLVTYIVAEGDEDVDSGGDAEVIDMRTRRLQADLQPVRTRLEFTCELTDAAGNQANSTGLVKSDTQLSIDAHPPVVASVDLIIVSTSNDTSPLSGERQNDQLAHIGSVLSFVVELQGGSGSGAGSGDGDHEADEDEGEGVDGSCTMNGHLLRVENSLFEYTVEKGDADVEAGQLHYDCVVRDEAGNTAHVTGTVGALGAVAAVDAHEPEIRGLEIIYVSNHPLIIGAQAWIRVHTMSSEEEDDDKSKSKAAHLLSKHDGVAALPVQSLDDSYAVTGSCTLNGNEVGLEVSEGLIMYIVKPDDANVATGEWTYDCTIEDEAGNLATGSGDVQGMSVAVEAHRPAETFLATVDVDGTLVEDEMMMDGGTSGGDSVGNYWNSSSTAMDTKQGILQDQYGGKAWSNGRDDMNLHRIARIGSHIVMTIVQDRDDQRMVVSGLCTINNNEQTLPVGIASASSELKVIAGAATVEYVVQANDHDSTGGQMTYSCNLLYSSGSYSSIAGYVAGYSIAIDAHAPRVDSVLLYRVLPFSVTSTGTQGDDDATTTVVTPKVWEDPSDLEDGLLGISDKLQFRIMTTDAASEISGVCVINGNVGHNASVTGSIFTATVHEGDADSANGEMAYKCTLADRAGNQVSAQGLVECPDSSVGVTIAGGTPCAVAIDAHRPMIMQVAIESASAFPAIIGSSVVMKLESKQEQATGIAEELFGHCRINDNQEPIEIVNINGGTYLSYVVSPGDMDIVEEAAEAAAEEEIQSEAEEAKAKQVEEEKEAQREEQAAKRQVDRIKEETEDVYGLVEHDEERRQKTEETPEPAPSPAATRTDTHDAHDKDTSDSLLQLATAIKDLEEGLEENLEDDIQDQGSYDGIKAMQEEKEERKGGEDEKEDEKESEDEEEDRADSADSHHEQPPAPSPQSSSVGMLLNEDEAGEVGDDDIALLLLRKGRMLRGGHADGSGDKANLEASGEDTKGYEDEHRNDEHHHGDESDDGSDDESTAADGSYGGVDHDGSFASNRKRSVKYNDLVSAAAVAASSTAAAIQLVRPPMEFAWSYACEIYDRAHNEGNFSGTIAHTTGLTVDGVKHPEALTVDAQLPGMSVERVWFERYPKPASTSVEVKATGATKAAVARSGEQHRKDDDGGSGDADGDGGEDATDGDGDGGGDAGVPVSNEILAVDDDDVDDDSAVIGRIASQFAIVHSTITIQMTSQYSDKISGSCNVNGVKGLPIVADDYAVRKYHVLYRVALGDASLGLNSSLPFECTFVDSSGNGASVRESLAIDFGIDAQPPGLKRVGIFSSSHIPAQVGDDVRVDLVTDHDTDDVNEYGEYPKTDIHQGDYRHKSRSKAALHLVHVGSVCRLNGRDVRESFVAVGNGVYMLTYRVEEDMKMWEGGKLPIHCELLDAAGNMAKVMQFTDGNDLAGRQIRPQHVYATSLHDVIDLYVPNWKLALTTCVICTASYTMATIVTKLQLPLITGYLITGVFAGPYVLQLFSKTDIADMRFVDEVALAYIGITAGAKFHLHEFMPLARPVMLISFCLFIFQYIVGMAVTMNASALTSMDFISAMSEEQRAAIGMLAGSLMVACSPSSFIAVVDEVNAKGPFTSVMLGIVVILDFVVILVYQISEQVSETVLSGISDWGGMAKVLFIQVVVSFAAGGFMAMAASYLVFWRICLPRKSKWFFVIRTVKCILLMAIGVSVFIASHLAHPWVEPLMSCLICGAVLSNYTGHSHELSLVTRDLSVLIYVTFFTLTGAAMEITMMVRASTLATVLTVTRMPALFLGFYLPGRYCNMPEVYNRNGWMAIITKAGVALGLAKKVQMLYPGWGSEFATIIVAVVVISQIIGPICLRRVLINTGEARVSDTGEALKQVGHALIVGVSSEADILEEELRKSGWEVLRLLITRKAASPAYKRMQAELAEAEERALLAAAKTPESSSRDPLSLESIQRRLEDRSRSRLTAVEAASAEAASAEAASIEAASIEAASAEAASIAAPTLTSATGGSGGRDGSHSPPVGSVGGDGEHFSSMSEGDVSLGEDDDSSSISPYSAANDSDEVDASTPLSGDEDAGDEIEASTPRSGDDASDDVTEDADVEVAGEAVEGRKVEGRKVGRDEHIFSTGEYLMPLRLAMIEFYQRHEPGKVPHVDTIIRSSKYELGKISDTPGERAHFEVLVGALAGKYGDDAVRRMLQRMRDFLEDEREATERGETSEELGGGEDDARGSIDDARGSVDDARGSIDDASGSIDDARGSIGATSAASARSPLDGGAPSAAAAAMLGSPHLRTKTEVPRTPLEIRFLRQGSDDTPPEKETGGGNFHGAGGASMLSSVLGRLEAPPPPSNVLAAAAIATHDGSQHAIDVPSSPAKIDPALLLKPVALASPQHSRSSSSGSEVSRVTKHRRNGSGSFSSLSGWFHSPPRNSKHQSSSRGNFDDKGEKGGVMDQDAQAILEERMFEVLHEEKTVNVLVALMPDDEQNLMVLRAAAAVWTQLGRSNMLKVIVKVVDDDGPNGTNWVRQYKSFLASDDRGDAVDVVVIKPAEATAKLLQLATFGKLPGLQSPSSSKKKAPRLDPKDDEGSTNPIHQLPPRQLQYGERQKEKEHHKRSVSEPSWLPTVAEQHTPDTGETAGSRGQLGKRGASPVRVGEARPTSRRLSKFSPRFTPKAGIAAAAAAQPGRMRMAPF